MYITLRYTLIFLILMHTLPHQGPSYVLLGDVASLQLWGNQADIHVEQGRGRIEIESELGLSFLFASPSGTCMSLCIGECTIRMYIPAENRVAMWFDEAFLSAEGIDTLQSEMNHGTVHLKNIKHADISLYRGEIDALVPPNGAFNLRGEALQGQISSYGGGWYHKVLHKGILFEDEEKGSDQSIVRVQFFRGKLDLLTDSVVMSVPE